MKKIFLMTFIFLNVLLINLNAAVWTINNVPNTKLKDARAYTSDPDNLIDAENQLKIDQLLYNIDQQATAEIFVVALNSTGDVDIKTFATDLFNEWGIGKKEKDNGLLILMVLDQKKISIETGYGMEGLFPDAICYRIIQNTMVPLVKEGQVGMGLLKGVESISAILANPDAINEVSVDKAAITKAKWENTKQNFRTGLYVYLFLTIIILILSIVNLNGKKKKTKLMEPYDGYKKINSSKTGFRILAILFPLTMYPFFLVFKGSLRKLRKQSRLCPSCGKPLVLMNEKQEDAYLSVGQQNEERVGSIDYDAWICMDCGHRTFLSYSKAFTRYQTCPKCHYKTYLQTADRIVSTPTPLSTGQGAHVFTCANCAYESIKYYTIPMIIILPVGRGGSGGSGGGGGFGGGMSGGGGSTGGW